MNDETTVNEANEPTPAMELTSQEAEKFLELLNSPRTEVPLQEPSADTVQDPA